MTDLRTTLGFGALLLTLLAAPAADAGGHRLYRHRSGYLHGASRPCHIQSQGSNPYYGDSGFGFGGGSAVDYVDYERHDFDSRRDRLLRHAAGVDVGYLRSSGRPGPVRTQPVEAGWVFLREGEAVKALGKFTARIMLAPGDAQARVGFALAASLLDDEVAAARAMRTAVRFDANVLRDFTSDETLDELIRGLLAGLEPETGEPTADARFLIASMRGLLHEYDAGLHALGEMGVDEHDTSTNALCRVLLESAAPPPETILVTGTNAP